MAIIRAVRERREARRMSRLVAHLDTRLLRDAGLEMAGSRQLAKPFWWLWRPED